MNIAGNDQTDEDGNEQRSDDTKRATNGFEQDCLRVRPFAIQTVVSIEAPASVRIDAIAAHAAAGAGRLGAVVDVKLAVIATKA